MSDLATINRLIRNVATSTKNQNVRVQTVAVMCIEHAVEHGDANPAMRLVDALAPRLRAPLVAWFEAYSRINVGKSAGKMTCSISKADARGWNLDGARVNPWYETAKAKADELPTTIEDLNDSVIRLADRMAKRLADGKVLEADRAAFEAKLAAIRAAA